MKIAYNQKTNRILVDISDLTPGEFPPGLEYVSFQALSNTPPGDCSDELLAQIAALKAELGEAQAFDIRNTIWPGKPKPGRA